MIEWRQKFKTQKNIYGLQKILKKSLDQNLSSSLSSSSFIHTYSIAIQQQEEKKEVKTELTIHWIKHDKGKKCVAAKGAKLSSWLLPQSGYKWVEVIQYL